MGRGTDRPLYSRRHAAKRPNHGEAAHLHWLEGMRNDVHWVATSFRKLLCDLNSCGALLQVISFDAYGVSGHPNHRAVHRGFL